MDANRLVNWCAYNAAGIRVGVAMEHPQGGYALANRTAGWNGDGSRKLVQFATLAQAQADFEGRQAPQPWRWERVEVQQ